ncbi:hypothetical protein HOK00_03410 [bacterium]|nr:hypothetical protein [bacterium]
MFLYKMKYFNQYYKENTICEFRGSDEREAKKLAIKNITLVDKKYIKKPYIQKDFEVISIDKTVIKPGKKYKTRDGRRVIIEQVERTTNSFFKVSGYIITERKGRKNKEDWSIWSPNGRSLAVGTDSKDLIEVTG